MEWDDLIIINADGNLVIYDDVELLRDLIHRFDVAPIQPTKLWMSEEDYNDIVKWGQEDGQA